MKNKKLLSIISALTILYTSLIQSNNYRVIITFESTDDVMTFLYKNGLEAKKVHPETTVYNNQLRFIESSNLSTSELIKHYTEKDSKINNIIVEHL